MKKIFVLAIVSLLSFTACGSGSETAGTANKNENLINYLVDGACMVAKYSGDVPDAEIKAINNKYGFESDSEVNDAIKLLTAEEAKDVKAKALPMITEKCENDFIESGFTPESFLDVAILPSQLNK